MKLSLYDDQMENPTMDHTEDSEEDRLLKSLLPLVPAIAKTFGPRCEVVLHDLRQLEKSVIAIENGHVSGRSLNSSILDAPFGDKGFRLIKETSDEDTLVNYTTRGPEGKLLKSTTVIIRNEKGNPIGAFCINFDSTDIVTVLNIIKDFVPPENDQNNDNSEDDILETVKLMINNQVALYPCSVAAMKKSDRFSIVSRLYEQGVFSAKGAIQLIADRLAISKFTVYSYLEEIRSLK